MIEPFENALKDVAVLAAQEITKDLRSYLISLGWPATAASAVVIEYENDDFKVDFDGPFREEAETYEYGSEVIRPTAAVRKYMNREETLHRIYFSILENKLGELV